METWMVKIFLPSCDLLSVNNGLYLCQHIHTHTPHRIPAWQTISCMKSSQNKMCSRKVNLHTKGRERDEEKVTQCINLGTEWWVKFTSLRFAVQKVKWNRKNHSNWLKKLAKCIKVHLVHGYNGSFVEKLCFAKGHLCASL